MASRPADPKLQTWILEEMKKCGHDIRTTGVYSYLFRCMRNNGELERMVDAFDEMRKESVTPPLYIYRQFVELCLAFKEPDLAYNLLKDAAVLDTFAAHQKTMYMDLLRSGALMGLVCEDEKKIEEQYVSTYIFYWIKINLLRYLCFLFLFFYENK